MLEDGCAGQKYKKDSKGIRDIPRRKFCQVLFMKIKPLSQEVPSLQFNRNWESLVEGRALYSFCPFFKNAQLTSATNRLLDKNDLDVTQNSCSVFLMPSSTALATLQGWKDYGKLKTVMVIFGFCLSLQKIYLQRGQKVLSHISTLAWMWRPYICFNCSSQNKCVRLYWKDSAEYMLASFTAPTPEAFFP